MELAFPGKPPQWPDGGRQEVNASGKDVGADASPLGQGPGVSPTSPYLIRPIKSSTYLEERKDLIKRRVRLACLTCRKRKIRCDIATSQSSSCTNCSRTGRACEVHQDRQHGESLKETRASMGFLSECSPPLHPLSLPRIEQRRRSRRGSGVLQERDVNARSDTQSIGSRRSNKSFMSGISVGSMKSCFSRCSVRSSRSILSQRSRISIKSLESRKSSRSFQSLGTGASTGSSRGGRSQSVYGQSSQAIYDWDDGWKSSRFPRPQPLYTVPALVHDDGLYSFYGPVIIEPPFTELSLECTADMPRRKFILKAARTGNDQLIDFLTSCSLADADQPPLPTENVSFSTPMLAAIGQDNTRVIEALLKQKDFNPTRRFCDLTYHEIAGRRRGLAWEDEVRLLKEAFDNASRQQSSNPQTKEPVILRLITDRSYSNPPSVSGEDIIDGGPGTDFYNCGWCRYSFSCTEQLNFHRERCFARPFSTTVKPDLTREKIAVHLKLQSSSLIKPIQTPLQPTPLVQVRTIRRTLSDPGLSISINKPRRHSTKPLDRGEIVDMNIPCLGLAGNGLDAMDLTSSSTLSTDNNLHADGGLSRQSVEGQATEILNPPRLFKTNSMTDLSSPKTTESSVRHASEATTPLTVPSQGDSEISDFSMNDGSEDSHCEEESPFVRRAERRRTSLRDLMDAVYSTYTRVATPGVVDGGESGPSDVPGGESDSTGPSNSRQNKDYNAKGKRPLPRGNGNNGEDEDGDQQQPKRRKPTTNNDGTNPTERFACPYYQRNRHLHLPRNYSFKGACYGPGFNSVHRVKEHLYRAHRLPPYCSRCNATFDSDLSLEKHTRQDRPCELIAKLPREGIDLITEKLLRMRSKEFSSKTEADKWRHVYSVLFPADDPANLPSPYYDNYLNASSVENSPELKPTAKSYDEFLQRELFRRIYRVLENKVDDALDSAEKNVVDGLKSQLEGIIRDVQTQLYEEFQTTFRPVEGQASDENNENASHMSISGMDPALLLTDVFPLSSFSPPWSALGLEHQQTGPSASIPQLPNELMDISNISFEPLSSPVETNQNHDSGMASSALFTVKAAHDYTSDYAEDLSFRVGQIITVTNDNEVEWYTGEYLDEFGMKRWGIFPRNLVERYPPPVPPRPTRGYNGNAGPASATFASTFLPSHTA